MKISDVDQKSVARSTRAEKGKSDGKDAALSGLAAESDLATMGLSYLLDDGES